MDDRIRKGLSEVTLDHEAGEIDGTGIQLKPEDVFGSPLVLDRPKSRSHACGANPLGQKLRRQTAAARVVDREIDEDRGRGGGGLHRIDRGPHPVEGSGGDPIQSDQGDTSAGVEAGVDGGMPIDRRGFAGVEPDLPAPRLVEERQDRFQRRRYEGGQRWFLGQRIPVEEA